MKYTDFAKKIKAKYPQYAQIDDRELAEKIVAKHPAYKEQVDFDSGFTDKVAGVARSFHSGMTDFTDVTSANLFSGVASAAGAVEEVTGKALGAASKVGGVVAENYWKGIGAGVGLFDKEAGKLVSGVGEDIGEQMRQQSAAFERAGADVNRFLSEGGREAKDILLKDTSYRDYMANRSEDFKPSDLTDPKFLMYDVYGSLIENAPTMALAIYTGGKVAPAIGAQGTVSSFLANVAGTTGFSTALNAAREAESAYSQSIEEGKSEDEAYKEGQRVYNRNFKANAGLEAAQMALLFMPRLRATSPFMSKLIGAAKLAGAGIFEATQERIEDVIQAQKGQSEFDYGALMQKLTNPNISKTDIVSAALGIIMQGAGNVFLDKGTVEKEVERQSDQVLDEMGIDGGGSERLAQEIESNPDEVTAAYERVIERDASVNEQARQAEIAALQADKYRDTVRQGLQNGKSANQMALEMSSKLGTQEAIALVQEVSRETPKTETKTEVQTETAPKTERVALEETKTELAKVDDKILEQTPADLQAEFTQLSEQSEQNTAQLSQEIDTLKQSIKDAKDGSVQKKNLKKELADKQATLKTAERDFNTAMTTHAESFRSFLDEYITKQYPDLTLDEQQRSDLIDSVALQLTSPAALKTSLNTPIRSIVDTQVAGVKAQEPVKTGEFKEARYAKDSFAYTPAREGKLKSRDTLIAQKYGRYSRREDAYIIKNSKREKFENELAGKKPEQKKAPKTQKEKVTEVVKKKGKASIKEVAEETGILEPNVRRILGVGAKDGTFERVAEGVYTVKIGDQDVAFIIPADAREALPKLAKEGFKADMVFLDIPYDTPAVKGGNRGVKYSLISVEDFDTILDNVKDILRTKDSPVVHMFSQAKSGLKKMTQYNELFPAKGFVPIARGDYTKLQKDGLTEYRNMRGVVPEPEGIIVFNQSGNFDKEVPNLNFRLVRPRGYQTEKPAEMLKTLIEMTTAEGDVVLDPFAGSGVSGEQAVKAGRKAVLVEKNKEAIEKHALPRVKKAAEEAKARQKKTISDMEAELRDAYKAAGKTEDGEFYRADQILSYIFMAMDIAEAGFRTGDSNAPEGYIAVQSTFPKWVPEELRRKKLFEKVMDSLEVEKISYPSGNRTAQRALYQAIFDELDAQLGVDTSAIRNNIIEAYETENNDTTEVEKPVRGESKGGQEKVKFKEKEPASPDDIPQDVARRAFENTSFESARRGETARNDYAATVNNLYAELSLLAKSDTQKDILDTEFQRFSANYKDAFVAYLNAHSRVASTMITGAANFPTRQNQKRSATADRRVDEMFDLVEKARKSISRKIKAQGIEDAGGEKAVADNELESNKKLLEEMREANKTVRKKNLTDEQKVAEIVENSQYLTEAMAREALAPDFAGRVGFPSYALTSVREKIKRLEKKTQRIEQKESESGVEEIGTFSGGRIVANQDIDRIQILFDEKPDAGMIAKLKSSGWRWSPREKAWQRQKTQNAVASAQRIISFAPVNEDGSNIRFKMRQVEEDLTTLVLERLGDKETTSREFIENLTNMPDMKQVERDLVRRVLLDMGEKIDVTEFRAKVLAELLPLRVAEAEETFDTMGESTGRGGRYEYVNLSDELRGDVENYREKIYESPINTSAGEVHFGGEGFDHYFAHTRIEDLGEVATQEEIDSLAPQAREQYLKQEKRISTRRIIELQSDLFQKGRLEQEDLSQRDASAPVLLRHATRQEEKQWLAFREENMKNSLTDEQKKEWDALGDKLFERARQAKKVGIEKLEPYRNTWWQRIVREEVRSAAQDNKRILQFPTGETAMKIEGLGGNQHRWGVVLDNGDLSPTLREEDLKVGLVIGDGNLMTSSDWIITDVSMDGTFSAIKMRNLEIMNDSVLSKMATELGYVDEKGDLDWTKIVADDEYLEELNNSTYVEGFSVSESMDTNNPIYRFYEKEVGRFLTSRYGATRVTDENGVDWYEVVIQDDYAHAPILAFKTQVNYEGTATIEEAQLYLSDLKERLNLDFDVHFVGSILADKKVNPLTKQVVGRVEAEGATADNTIALVRDMAKYTAQHETVHLTLANLDRIPVFRNQGMTRDKILQAKAREMGVELTASNENRVEEQLALDFENYVARKEPTPAGLKKFKQPTGIIRKFFILLHRALVRFAKAIGETKGDIITDYFDLLSEGRARDTEMTYLENKGIMRSFIEDGVLDTENMDVLLANKIKPMETDRANEIADRIEAVETRKQRGDILGELSDAELVALDVSPAGNRVWLALEDDFAVLLDAAMRNVSPENFKFKVREEGDDAYSQKLKKEYNDLVNRSEELENDTLAWKTDIEQELMRRYETAELVESTSEDVRALSRTTKREKPPVRLTDTGVARLEETSFANQQEAEAEITAYLKRKTELVQTRNKLRELRRDIAAAKKEGKLTKAAMRDVERRLKLRQRMLERKDYYVNMGFKRGEKENMRMIRHRGRALRDAQDFFMISDAKAKEIIGGKRIHLLSEQEFDDFLIEFSNKAQLTRGMLDARDEVRAFVQEQQFSKIDNLRKAMGLPSVDKMTEIEARRFLDTLAKYQFGDTFLTQRELETIHRTNWGEMKTERELLAKLKEHTGTGREEMATLTAPENGGYYTPWIRLARSHPFFNWLVGKRVEATIKAEREFISIEEEVNSLVRSARRSRRKKLPLKERVVEAIIPTDEVVFGYMEAENKVEYALEKEMTAEELALADYLTHLYFGAYEYMRAEYGMRGRENYMTHVRRSFFEALKESGVSSAFREILTSQREEEAAFKILDEETGETLAFEKFFGYAMRRSGALVPSKNVARASLAYFRAFAKKKAMDEFIPEAMLAVQAHKAIKGTTEKGLSKDPTLEKFVKRFINDAKGRRVWFITKQGSRSDIALRAMTMWITIKFLGLNVATSVANFIGDFTAIFWELSLKEASTGVVRTLNLPRTHEVNKQFRFFTGRNPIVELFDPQYNLPSRTLKAIMVLMSLAAFQSNKFFLRSKLTAEEFATGAVSDERLTEIAQSLSRVKPNAFYVKSLAGNTTAGGANFQFGTWAVAIFNTVTSDAIEVGKIAKNKGSWDAISSQEALKLYKFGVIAGIALVLTHLLSPPDDDDDSFYAQVFRKAQRELTTLTQALQFVANPANYALAVKEISQWYTLVEQLITQEKYKTDGVGYGMGDPKWIRTAERLITPTTLKHFFPQEKENTKDRLIQEALDEGTLDAASIVDFLYKDTLEEKEGDELVEYRTKKEGEITALYNLRRKYPDSTIGNIIVDEDNNKDRVAGMIQYAKEVGVDTAYSELKELYHDRDLCANTKKKTGCLVSGQLFKDFQRAKRDL